MLQYLRSSAQRNGITKAIGVYKKPHDSRECTEGEHRHCTGNHMGLSRDILIQPTLLSTLAPRPGLYPVRLRWQVGSGLCGLCPGGYRKRTPETSTQHRSLLERSCSLLAASSAHRRALIAQTETVGTGSLWLQSRHAQNRTIGTPTQINPTQVQPRAAES